MSCKMVHTGLMSEEMTWTQENMIVMAVQSSPRGPGSRRAAQAMDRKFAAKVGKACRANNIEFISLYAAISALDEACVPNQMEGQ